MREEKEGAVQNMVKNIRLWCQTAQLWFLDMLFNNCVKERESWFAKSHLTLYNPTVYSLPGSSVHGIFQERILEWVVTPFSRGSSQSREWTQVSCTAGRFFTVWATREVQTVYPWAQQVTHCASISSLGTVTALSSYGLGIKEINVSIQRKAWQIANTTQVSVGKVCVSVHAVSVSIYTNTHTELPSKMCLFCPMHNSPKSLKATVLDELLWFSFKKKSTNYVGQRIFPIS